MTKIEKNLLAQATPKPVKKVVKEKATSVPIVVGSPLLRELLSGKNIIPICSNNYISTDIFAGKQAPAVQALKEVHWILKELGYKLDDLSNPDDVNSILSQMGSSLRIIQNLGGAKADGDLMVGPDTVKVLNKAYYKFQEGVKKGLKRDELVSYWQSAVANMVGPASSVKKSKEIFSRVENLFWATSGIHPVEGWSDDARDILAKAFYALGVLDSTKLPKEKLDADKLLGNAMIKIQVKANLGKQDDIWGILGEGTRKAIKYALTLAKEGKDWRDGSYWNGFKP